MNSYRSEPVKQGMVMSADRNIDVSWECVSDGLTKEGHNFRDAIVCLLDEGNQVTVEMPVGQAPRPAFTAAGEFTEWFDAIAARVAGKAESEAE